MRLCLALLAAFIGFFNPVSGQEVVQTKPEEKVSFGFAYEYVGKDGRLVVKRIMESCAMFKAGMRNDDVIVSINDIQMTRNDEQNLNVLRTEALSLNPAKIVVLRGAESLEFLIQATECSFPSFSYEYDQNEGRWTLVE